VFYVLLKSDGTVDRYPYTLTDLCLAHPQTSFSSDISDEVAASFNCFPVELTTPPADDYKINLERTAIKKTGKWIEKWTAVPATPKEITERTATKAGEVRAERNSRLEACDWTQLSDAPVDRTAWATYRQALRDVSKQSGFPWNTTWPTEP